MPVNGDEKTTTINGDVNGVSTLARVIINDRCRSGFGKKCFSHKGATLWNDLSIEIKSSKTYEIFKKHICKVNENPDSLMHVKYNILNLFFIS